MRIPLGFLLVTLTALAACNKQEAANGMEGKSPGRYAGIGTFSAGRLWQHMTGVPDAKDPKAAELADDEHVIVVLDSHTGEVRQCGDHSGVCVAMNPWKSQPIVAPMSLDKHAAELDREAEAELNDADNAAAPAHR